MKLRLLSEAQLGDFPGFKDLLKKVGKGRKCPHCEQDPIDVIEQGYDRGWPKHYCEICKKDTLPYCSSCHFAAFHDPYSCESCGELIRYWYPKDQKYDAKSMTCPICNKVIVTHCQDCHKELVHNIFPRLKKGQQHKKPRFRKTYGHIKGISPHQ
jgi:hypothetical protein